MRSWQGATISGIALLACVAALATILLLSLSTADRYFDRSIQSQEQLAAVSTIEATAAVAALVANGDEVERRRFETRLDQQLSAYRRSIDVESAILARHGESQQVQQPELADASAIRRLALRAVAAANPAESRAALAQLRLVVGRAVERERGESAAVLLAMTRLRVTVVTAGIALAVTAAALAAASGMTLLSSNRRLTRLVAERTGDLAGKNERLAEIDRTRRLFFAKLSHELRTPITVMRGEAEVALRLDSGDAPARDAFSQIVVQAGYLDRRLDELLGIARAEDGRLTLDSAPFDVVDMVRQASVLATPFAVSNDIAFHLQVPGSVVTVNGDARWLAQALLTVIDNGIKFSEGGTALGLTVNRVADRVVIAVADQGIGIDAADLPHVFEPYYRSAAAHSRTGVGLGLALARWVVEQQDGTISAANAPGGGCVVTIDLPVAA